MERNDVTYRLFHDLCCTDRLAAKAKEGFFPSDGIRSGSPKSGKRILMAGSSRQPNKKNAKPCRRQNIAVPTGLERKKGRRLKKTPAFLMLSRSGPYSGMIPMMQKEPCLASFRTAADAQSQQEKIIPKRVLTFVQHKGIKFVSGSLQQASIKLLFCRGRPKNNGNWRRSSFYRTHYI